MRRIIVLVSALLGALVLGSVSAESPENPWGLRVHHVTALVAELPRAIGWYQSVLGFKLKEQGGHGDVQFAVLSIPGFEVALVKTPEAHIAPSQSELSTPHWVHIVFSTADPNRLFNEFKSRGAHPYVHGKPPDGPVQTFLIKDSEGNEIEIVASEDAPLMIQRPKGARRNY